MQACVSAVECLSGVHKCFQLALPVSTARLHVEGLSARRIRFMQRPGSYKYPLAVPTTDLDTTGSDSTTYIISNAALVPHLSHMDS
jgi:hypothetical protein